MSDSNPLHGEIVTVTYPARKRRRRWCGYCSTWTWEAGDGVFRHGPGGGAYCRSLRRAGAKLKPR